MAISERLYFQRRARQELESAMRADSIEAETSHALLAGLHLRHCSACIPGKSRECSACALVHICDSPRGEGAPRWRDAGMHSGQLSAHDI
ncbi:hypothetical protein BH10PSE14_BH10PSE14_45230 [soil metagenome]